MGGLALNTLHTHGEGLKITFFLSYQATLEPLCIPQELPRPFAAPLCGIGVFRVSRLPGIIPHGNLEYIFELGSKGFVEGGMSSGRQKTGAATTWETLLPVKVEVVMLPLGNDGLFLCPPLRALHVHVGVNCQGLGGGLCHHALCDGKGVSVRAELTLPGGSTGAVAGFDKAGPAKAAGGAVSLIVFHVGAGTATLHGGGWRCRGNTEGAHIV